MGSVRLGVGAEWLLDGRAFRVVRQTAPDAFVALDLKFHREESFTEERLLALYAEGRLRFATDEEAPAAAADPPAKNPSVHDLTSEQRRTLRRRWRAIEPLTRLPHPPTAEDFRRRARELSRRGSSCCSARSLRRHWKAWLEAGRDRRALVPATGRRGGRGRSRRTGLLERHPALRHLVDEAIGNVYLTTARRPISAVTRRVFDDLARRNARLPADQAVPVPREATLARAVARRIARLDPWEVDRARWGRRIADRRHAPTRRQRLARRILERVEIDHSPLKVVVGNEAGPIGQPWLTVLIDYHSRMIVGFCLGFEPPSHAVVMEALRHAVLPPSRKRRVRAARFLGPPPRADGPSPEEGDWIAVDGPATDEPAVLPEPDVGAPTAPSSGDEPPPSVSASDDESPEDDPDDLDVDDWDVAS